MTKVSGFLHPGCVVEFMQGNAVQLAWVLEESSGRLRLLTATKREAALSASRVLPWSGPEHPAQAGRQEILDRLAAHQRRREELEAQVKALEIWDMAQGEVDHAPAQWFAGLVWEKPGPDEIAAMGRALLAAKTHFKFQPPDFEVHPADKVEARLRQQTEMRERELLLDGGQALFKALWERTRSGRQTALPDLDEDTALRLKALLFAAMAKNLNEAEAKLWDSLRKGLPEHPYLALLLAEAWELVSAHHNQLLDEVGYPWGDAWSATFAAEIEGQVAAFDAARQEPEPLPLVSIDAPTTRDIDDAFHIEPGPDGGFRLWIALARPNVTWTFGSPLDQAVFQRSTSLYLPEGTSHMMPERLGTDLFSLRAGQPRAALLVEMVLDAEGLPVSVTPRCAWVRVEANISYAAAEEALDAGRDERLALGLRLAEKRIARRVERGASVIQKPEPEIILEGGGRDVRVRIELKEPHPKAELVISEFMILVNAALAGWAAERGVPLLHRTQDIALPQDAAGIFTEPSDIFGAVKLLTPPSLELAPRRHAALGVPAYSPISSPIRRYTDLLNLGQVSAFLETGAPRLTAAELETLLPHLSARIQAVSQVQRFRPRYWKLVYLAQQGRRPHDAVLVDDSGPYPTLALPQYQINVRAPRQMLGDKLYPGQRFEVVFGRIDALTNELKVLEAREA
jgi:exoribonuclease-2